jgi:hypothetical protein
MTVKMRTCANPCEYAAGSRFSSEASAVEVVSIIKSSVAFSGCPLERCNAGNLEAIALLEQVA